MFDQRWAMAVLGQALERLRAEQVAAGKEPMFALLRPFLTDTAEAGDYEPVAAKLRLTPNAVAVAVNRLRSRYRQLVRLEVAAPWSTRRTWKPRCSTCSPPCAGESRRNSL